MMCSEDKASGPRSIRDYVLSPTCGIFCTMGRAWEIRCNSISRADSRWNQLLAFHFTELPSWMSTSRGSGKVATIHKYLQSGGVQRALSRTFVRLEIGQGWRASHQKATYAPSGNGYRENGYITVTEVKLWKRNTDHIIPDQGVGVIRCFGKGYI